MRCNYIHIHVALQLCKYYVLRQPDAKNRPSFKQILAHLKWIKKGKFLSYTPEDYLAVRAEWREEIDSHFDTLELGLNDQLGEDYELVVQRKEELK